jgi:hypothetical protein
MISYIVLGLIVLFFNLKIGLTLQYRLRLKRIFKDQLINKNEIVMNGMTYKIHYIPCSKNTQFRVNSHLFIEVMSPRQQKQQLISVNLKRPTLVITSPIITKLRWVINENEERFLNDQEQVFSSYIIPFDKLSSFKETFS